jgi:hypothetical protein
VVADRIIVLFLFSSSFIVFSPLLSYFSIILLLDL